MKMISKISMYFYTSFFFFFCWRFCTWLLFN